MELWFALALLSTLAGGTASFVYKIAAVYKIDATVLSIRSSLVSFSLLAVFFLCNGDFSHLYHPMLAFAFVGAFLFFATQLIKIEALQEIDAAVFFPLYKVTGPLLAIVSGVVFFGEFFSTMEWVGLILSLLVPLLLISKAEDARQNNLLKGVLLVLLCAVVSAVSISAMKVGTDIAPNIWGFILFGEFFAASSAVVLLIGKHKGRVKAVLRNSRSIRLTYLSVVLGCAHALGAFTLVFAFAQGGPLGIVYTINSLYILIPIVLSIIFYNEHWNVRKVVAIILSIAALAFLR